MKFGPKFTDLHSSPKERQLQKNHISFGEECILSHATYPGAPSYGGVRTWVDSSQAHALAEASKITQLLNTNA